MLLFSAYCCCNVHVHYLGKGNKIWHEIQPFKTLHSMGRDHSYLAEKLREDWVMAILYKMVTLCPLWWKGKQPVISKWFKKKGIWLYEWTLVLMTCASRTSVEAFSMSCNFFNLTIIILSEAGSNSLYCLSTQLIWLWNRKPKQWPEGHFYFQARN